MSVMSFPGLPVRGLRALRAFLVPQCVIVACIAGLCLAVPGAAETGPVVLKGGTSVSEHVWQNVLAQRWADLITERSEGRVTVENHCGAILGSDNAMGEKTMMGALQWYYTSTSNLARMVKEMATFELPYLVENERDNLKLFYVDGKLGGPLTDNIQKALAKKNLRLMWVGGVMFRSVFNSKRELRVPADAAGLKLRVTASDLEREDVASWGASPVPMGYGEVYTAMQQGTIDGLGVSMPEGFPMKFHEVCPYVTNNKFNSYAAVILMNLDAWNSLSPDMQKLVSDVSDEVVKYDAENKSTLYDAVYAEKLTAAGMKITDPAPREMDLWRKTTMDAVWPKAIGKLIDAEWVEQWKRLLGK